MDVTLSLHHAVRVLLAAPEAEARALGEALVGRAEAGVGGEIRFEWNAGSAWLDAALRPVTALGGTGPHAARVLTHLGAPALLALEHRDAEQMACLGGGILLACNGKATAARDIAPSGTPRAKIYIFEFTAGGMVRARPAPRSSRIIVRFTDPEPEQDADFEALSVGLAGRAGAGVLSGFNAAGSRNLDAALARAHALALRWQAHGLCLIHLEMGGYDTPALRDRTLGRLRGAYTSLGLSQSEYQALVPGEAPESSTVIDTAERLGMDRLCIHADAWALAATRGDPEREREALMVGCLLAGARAARGVPDWPAGIDPRARFGAAPDEHRRGDWSIVACAAPYLRHPLTTLGLGDTFMAGTLLVLGGAPA